MGIAGLLDLLFPPREDELALRGVSSDGFLSRMAPRVAEGVDPPAIALFSFGDPAVRSAIHEAKYHGSEEAFALLSAALAEYLRDGEEVRLGTPCLVPIPLGRRRRKERGFNQAEEIVRRVALELHLDADYKILERTRETASQISLPRRERAENMRGAFRAAHPSAPSFTYILVDDVTTTGATMQAAVDALRKAGARHIIPLALAH